MAFGIPGIADLRELVESYRKKAYPKPSITTQVIYGYVLCKFRKF